MFLVFGGFWVFGLGFRASNGARLVSFCSSSSRFSFEKRAPEELCFRVLQELVSSS